VPPETAGKDRLLRLLEFTQFITPKDPSYIGTLLLFRGYDGGPQHWFLSLYGETSWGD